MATRSQESNTSTPTGGRIPPQDLNAEKSLLGALLLSDASFPDVLELVRPADFYDQRHRQIYAAFVSLYDHHRPIDLLTVTSELVPKSPNRPAAPPPKSMSCWGMPKNSYLTYRGCKPKPNMSP